MATDKLQTTSNLCRRTTIAEISSLPSTDGAIHKYVASIENIFYYNVSCFVCNGSCYVIYLIKLSYEPGSVIKKLLFFTLVKVKAKRSSKKYLQLRSRISNEIQLLVLLITTVNKKQCNYKFIHNPAYRYSL